MKRHLTKTAAVIAIGASALTAQAADRITADNLRQNLFATCFVSQSEGWTVGDLGRVFHTTDAGKTWETQDAGTRRPFSSLTCQGGKLRAAGQGGQIGASDDGGKTWTMQKSGVTRQLLDIAFANPQLGLAVGDAGTLLRTEDGGGTWTKVALPTDTKLPPDIQDVVDPGDIVLYGVSFGDADHVWVAGEFGIIFASSDGGKTWQQQPSNVETTLFGVNFTDPQHGWAAGIDAVLLMTSDGGQTWEKLHIETPKGFILPLYDVAVQGNYGWAIGNSGFLLQTKDAGKTWQLVDVPVKMASSWFRGISMLPDGRGFVVGARGLVLSADRENYSALKQNF